MAVRMYRLFSRGHRLSLSLLLTLAGTTVRSRCSPGSPLPPFCAGFSTSCCLLEHTSRVLSARDLNLFWPAAAELMGLQLAALLLAWWIRITALQVSQDVLATFCESALSGHFYRLLPALFHTGADVENRAPDAGA